MSTYSWIATEMRTGVIIDDLPGLTLEQVKDSLCRYESAQGRLALPMAPPSWERAILPGGSCLHLVDDQGDGQRPVPVWGGFVLEREPSTGDEIPVSAATMPAYFDRRFVGTRLYDGVGQNDIVADLVRTYAAQGSNGGIPIRVETVSGGAGKLRKRQYDDADDKTLYSALTELAAIKEGPEWYVGWEWQSNPERITPVLYVGDRVGATALPGLRPAATFEVPGPVTTAAQPWDYKTGRGATDVMATSSATADERPQSRHVITLDSERPTYEHRFTPSTSIVDTDTLDGHAERKSEVLAGGAKTLNLSSVMQADATDGAPRLGTDWSLGDDIGYVIGGLDRHGDDLVPAFPGGLDGVARDIGYEIDMRDLTIVTPILAGADL